MLQHASAEELAFTRTDWLACLDTLPLHQHRSVREAFCLQIHCFTWNHVLQGVLGGDDESTTETSHELEMLGKLRDALSVSEVPDISQTLLESVAEVAKAACQNRRLLFYSLVLLLEQLDHKELPLRTLSVTLIHRVAASGFSTAGGVNMQVSLCLLSMVHVDKEHAANTFFLSRTFLTVKGTVCFTNLLFHHSNALSLE